MKFVNKVLVFLFVICLSVGCFKFLPVLAEDMDISVLSITKTYGDSPFSLSYISSSNGRITYSSSNKKVVTVSKKGKVTIKGCGEADIKIKAKGNHNYKDSISKITITVKPEKQLITNLSTKERNIYVNWKRDKKADGYYIYYSTDYKFSNDLHKIKISKNKITSKTITGLKRNTKYYVKVCSYKKVKKKIILGSFSDIRSEIIRK